MQPTSIRKIGQVAMRFSWPGDHNSEFSARELRLLCRCAACRHELTGESLLNTEQVPLDIKIVASHIIGNYALGFQFSDGHQTGIYTFENLRKDCPCCNQTPKI